MVLSSKHASKNERRGFRCLRDVRDTIQGNLIVT